MAQLKFEYLLQEEYDRLLASGAVDKGTLYRIAEDQGMFDEMLQDRARAAAMPRTDEDILYTQDHRFTPNGHGDYDQICPHVGKVCCWPYMWARAQRKFVCEVCDQLVRPLPGPWQEEVRRTGLG